MGEGSTTQRSELIDKLRLDRRKGRDGGMGRAPSRGALAAVTIVALVALAAAWTMFGAADAPLVETAVARAATGAASEGSVLDASGYVTARRQATVSAKITGKVVEVLIEEGMRVQEGQLLARLDSKEADAQLALALAQLDAARTQIAEVQARLDQAEREQARQQQLARQRATSMQAMEAARAERDTLRARLANAREQVRVAEETVGVARVQVENTEIRAPFTGVVVAKAAQPGEMISPISAGGGFTRTGIGTVVDMDSLEIEVDVNESFINRVTAQQPVEATLNAYPEWKIPAEVIAVVPTADRSKATVKVRVAIHTKDSRIVPDMGVRVAFLRSDAQPAKLAAAGTLVPVAAVRSVGEERVVFVYDDGHVERRSVKLGQGSEVEHQILSGVEAGERVVVSPPEALRDGDSVRISETG
ncbi:MAG TPA: efflux RND transporter periplasmic adaptor subunit [Candidatus Binatia bacterium]|nr:efflux RND transporter periplasmic adaptor subunit [Candidatus Binatia bacterium]